MRDGGLHFEDSLQFAKELDKKDELRDFRSRFYIPIKEGNPVVYFCGNSLGLQPKSASLEITKVLDDWRNMGVAGHFKGENPWATYHLRFKNLLAPILGALPSEVVAMNSLTANLHLMLATFYKPNSTRFKILTESRNFSSDIYALQSQVQLHGISSGEAIVEIPSENEVYDEEVILKMIREHSENLALVMLSGVNYYTGQYLRLKEIVEATHKVGAILGLDLAHAIGNVPLTLHDWEVDFAVWCSYKYLNSGPGAVGGLFIHEKHAKNTQLVRPAGWWGNRPEDRFQMNKNFIPSPDADGYQLSNAPVLAMAVHDAALKVFQEASIEKILEKSRLLTGYLVFLIEKKCVHPQARFRFKILTPPEESRHGAQISVEVLENCVVLYQLLLSKGFIVDMRSEKVLRITPVPLYNTFEEVFLFVEELKEQASYLEY